VQAAVAGDKYSYRELDDFTDLISRTLLGIPQASKTQRAGVLNQTIYLDYSQERLASYGFEPVALRNLQGVKVGRCQFLTKCYNSLAKGSLSCPGLLGCMRRLDCCRVSFEALGMRRAVYLLLAVSLVQLSGLAVVCVPRDSQTHPCCPMPDKTRLPNSSSLPDCCVNYILNCQGSITEARNTDSPSGYAAQFAAAPVRSAVPSVAVNRSVLQHVSPPISPPLSPLSQSCLLLI
jgi:hypothetical protein